MFYRATFVRIDGWEKPLIVWEPFFGSKALRLLVTMDRSTDEVIDKRHLFQLCNGRYAYVHEYASFPHGYSCHETTDYRYANASIATFDQLVDIVAYWNSRISRQSVRWHDAELEIKWGHEYAPYLVSRGG